MNTISKLLLGAAVFTLGACSSDEPTPAPDVNPDNGEKSTMYLDVSITSNGAGSRATSPGWYYGDADEHDIKNAYFYFFDADRRFVAEANVWDGGTDGEDSPNGNIEFKGKQTLILRGLQKNALPKYLITILNKPIDFEAGNTLESTVSKLMDVAYKISYTEGGTTKEKDVFIMSTSSFGPTVDVTPDAQKKYDVAYPFVNVLSPDNFYTEGTTATEENRVQIYVERLAAKFEVLLPDNQTVFPVEVTVAGEVNNQVQAAPSGHTKLYVKVLGYGLTGTEKKSYLSKDITGLNNSANPNFITTKPWDKWCDCANYRSYWGQSVNYGKIITISGTGNPLDRNNPTDAKLNTDATTLHYTNWTEVKEFKTGEGVKNYIYSTENTNKPNNIRSESEFLIAANVTNLILTAQIFSDEACTKNVELVSYGNVYFTREQFRKYILQRLNEGNGLNFYWGELVETTGAGTKEDPKVEHYKYTQISADDIELVDGDGKTTGYGLLRCKRDKFNGQTIYYKTVEEGKEVYKPVEEAGGKDAVSQIEDKMALLVNDTDKRANLFKDGKMFYNVPIEHINETRTADEIKEMKVKDQGNYGVVRNHWYQVKIKKIMRLGQGIFNPDGGEGQEPEPIIPENPNNERFAVAAQINVLSWKLVLQDVEF